MSDLLAEIPIDMDALARLESQAAASTDLALKTLLIETLADRCVSIGCEKYLERLRQHMGDLPPGRQHFPLAFLAALEGRSDEARQHFVRYTERIIEGQKAPPDSDFAWRFGQRLNCIAWFLNDDGADAFWNSVSAIFAEKWPNAPISAFYGAAATPANRRDGKEVMGDVVERLRFLDSILDEGLSAYQQ